MVPLNNNRQGIVISFTIMLMLVSFVVFLASCSQDKAQTPPQPKPLRSGSGVSQPKPTEIDLRNTVAVIETVQGIIEIEFYSDETPETAKNFAKNVRLKFYDGEPFHRVESGQLIQAGSGLVKETMALEKSSRQLTRGVVAMAGDGETESHASQFYICLDKLEIDGQPTIFGYVTSGLDVLDKIQKDDKIVKATLKQKE